MARKVTTVEIETVSVDVPIGDCEPIGYQRQLTEGGDVPLNERGMHLNLHLGRKAAKAFVRFRDGLRKTNGDIATNADALRWLFESIADASEK